MTYLKEILFLLGDRRWKLPWLASLFLGSSMFDLLGLSLIGPYTMLILDPDSLNHGYLSSVMHFFGASTGKDMIISLSVVLLAVFVIKAVSVIFINKQIIKFAWDLQAELKSSLMSAYQRLDYVEYLRRNSSEYIQTIHNFTSTFTTSVLQNALRLTSEGVVTIAIIGMLLTVNPAALLLLISLLGLTILFYDRVFRRNLYEYGQQTCDHGIRLTQGISEGIEGLKEIRILGREGYFHHLVRNSSEEYSYYNIKCQMIATVPRYLVELIIVAFLVLLVVGTYLMGFDTETLLPTISVFGMAAMRLMPSANMVMSGLSQMRVARHATSVLCRDMSQLLSGSIPLERENHRTLASPVFESLVLDGLWFRYPSSQVVLKDISIRIEAGESIGIIGTSGSGKTTLVDIMLGLLDPIEGKLIYNGLPLDKHMDAWRACVAYLPQHVFLMDNTLRHNVAMGIEDADIDEQRLQESLRQARLADLVEQLPDGLETMLGERGVRLSGGQRQRVALARAFYHERSVLVMDESTSALDKETEREIVDEIRRLKGNKTMIVIAHRLTTLQHCDRIYRLEKGEIVQVGAYEEVIGRET